MAWITSTRADETLAPGHTHHWILSLTGSEAAAVGRAARGRGTSAQELLLDFISDHIRELRSVTLASLAARPELGPIP